MRQSDMGTNYTNKLVYKALHHSPQADEFDDFADNVAFEDYLLGETNYSIIEDCFNDHGINLSCGDCHDTMEKPLVDQQNSTPTGNIESPSTYCISQNYPNPFNPETKIHFQLPEDVHVTLSIYNMLGQKVRMLVDKQMSTGFHTIKWDGRNNFGTAVASGVYLYAIQAGKYYEKKKMVLMR